MKLRFLVLLLAAATAQAAELTATAQIGAYPGYPPMGSNAMPPGGELFLVQPEQIFPSSQLLLITGKLWALGAANMRGGLHIHVGTTCSDASLVGGHYFPGMPSDPWTTIKYSANDEAKATIAISMPNFTLSGPHGVVGRAIVVHDAANPATRIGCGIIKLLNRSDVGALNRSDVGAGNEEAMPEGEGSKPEGEAGVVQEMCELAHPFDRSGLLALKAVTIISAFLSVLGSGFIIGTWLLQSGTRRSLGMHVIYCLSIADLFSSLVFIVDGLSPTGDLIACGGSASDVASLCMLDAAGAQFFGLSAVLWTGCIAVGLHLGVLRRSKLATQRPAALIRYMHLGVWGTSLLSLLIMIAANTLGPTGQWCWVRLDAWWAMLVFYYIPLLLVFGYSMAIYYLTRRTFLSMHREAESAMGGDASGTGAGGALPNLTKRLLNFILVFGVIHAVQLLNRVYDVIFPGRPSFVLYLLHSLLGPMQGLGNAFCYGWSPLTRRVWSNACPRLCGWAATNEGGNGGGGVGGGGGGDSVRRGAGGEVVLSGGIGGNDQLDRVAGGRL